MAFVNANPKIKTERFKIYIDVGTSGLTPVWELQGRGVASWSIDENQDINKVTDVLGFVDMERGTSQPVQSGVELMLRDGSAFCEMLSNAWYEHNYDGLDNVKILQKFEYIADETNPDTDCRARLQNGCLISINSLSALAGGYITFNVDIHYSNDFVFGTMPYTDGTPITFTPD